jgi:processive 1,2-diacylglycerol beta-glucosyltransferase
MGLLYERSDQPWPHRRPRLALDRLNTQLMSRLREKVQPDLLHCDALFARRDSGLADCQEKIAGTQCSDGLRRPRPVAVPDGGPLRCGIAGVGRVPGADRGTAGKTACNRHPGRPAVRKTGGSKGSSLAVAPGLGSAGGADCGSALADGGHRWQVGETEEAAGTNFAEAWKLAGGEDRLVTIGFTQEMDQYMAAADLLVWKAGGWTTSGSVGARVALAIVEPIPCQEARKADHSSRSSVENGWSGGMPGKAGSDEARGGRDGAAAGSAGHRRRCTGAAKLIRLPERYADRGTTEQSIRSRL